LDIVVEAFVGVAVAFEVTECLFALEILELYDHLRVNLFGGLHEIIHELLLDLSRRALLAEAEVEGVLEVGLIVRAAVEDDGKSLLGVDAGSTCVESELTNL
jgi:hypothetical protein